jgi:hypothetical protein
VGDRHRRDRRQAVTASARILQPVREDNPKKLQWHDEAWGFRDTVGELRFAEMWLGNAFSRSRLIAARRPSPGEEPQPVEDGPAYDLVGRLAGGVGGQSALLRNFAPFLMIPGIGYLVGEPKGRVDKFVVVDSEDIKVGTSKEGGPGFELRVDDGTMGWRHLPEGTVVTKVYRPHPRRRWEPDSPTRAALGILRELVLLTMHVEATATSRLAGAGVQAFPSEMEFPDGWEKFIAEYLAAVTKPIKNRDLAAAKAPFPVRMPANVIEAFKNGYINYSNPFDEHALKLREEAITRLGNAMDMPRQILTGEKQNHWGDWQVEEAGLKMHVEPGLETICDGLTVGYLQPGLQTGRDQSKVNDAALREEEDKTPEGEWLIWYDTSDLRVRPDRSQAAGDAYDRWEIDGDVFRKELGLSDAEAVDIKDPATLQRIWLKLLDTDLASVALVQLGLVEPDEISVSKGPFGQPEVAPTGGEPPPPATPPGDGGRGLPERQPQQQEPAPTPAPPVRKAAEVVAVDGQLGLVAAAEVPDYPPPATSGEAIVFALDGIVHRAMERAGRRVLNKLPRGEGGRLARSIDGNECPAERLHTCTHLDRYLPADTLFDGAWDRVPEIAERLNEDPEVLIATCEAYCRMLVSTQVEHSFDGLARALGVCPCEA